MMTLNPAADSLIAICLFAAFSDGEKSDAEREQVRRLAEELGSVDLATLSRQILMGKLSLATAVDGIESRSDRMLAYEMARAVCEANGSISDEEQAFLGELSELMQLGKTETRALNDQVDACALAPVESVASDSSGVDSSGMILRYSILNGALELLPETLATMAIIPMQVKMVYRIGKSHGVELNRSSIMVFLAAAGVGASSQMMEGFARKLMRQLGKKIGGKLAGSAASQATGSAFSFASTYAIGHLAEKYYAGGSKLGTPEIKQQFTSLSAQAREMHAKYLPEIQARAGSLTPGSIMEMVRGKTVV